MITVLNGNAITMSMSLVYFREVHVEYICKPQVGD